jgi:uncharacterized membrane protein YdjX (TVP38/TMEM64 family)
MVLGYVLGVVYGKCVYFVIYTGLVYNIEDNLNSKIRHVSHFLPRQQINVATSAKRRKRKERF